MLDKILCKIIYVFLLLSNSNLDMHALFFGYLEYVFTLFIDIYM